MKRKILFLFSILFLITILPLAASTEEGGDPILHKMVMLVFQVAVIIVVARLAGMFFSRVLKQPSSLGEIVAGMIIGPYALGQIKFPIPDLPGFFTSLFDKLPGTSMDFSHFQFFPIEHNGAIPVSVELYGLAVIASVILLFLSGLETDLPTFLRFSGKGSLVGLGGVIFSFVLGDLSAVFFLPGVDSFMSSQALFLGTLSTATSVGITARILTERKKMGSPEGVTILAGAVLDDVIGIIILAIVIGLSGNEGVNGKQIAWIAGKAFGFWIICTALGIIFIPKLTKKLKKLKSIQAVTGISLGMALMLAGLSEMAGLAMIIGAYIMGLSFSQTDISHQIQEKLEGIYDFLVPIFFCVMGMMVNFSSMNGVIVFGLIYTFFAIIAKVFGCGLPAMLLGFNLKGGMRIGLGMLPRGEVALIIAGIGLSKGIIGEDIFGVSVIMLLITTLMAPPLLVQSFKGGSGYKKKFRKDGDDRRISVELELGNRGMADLFRKNMLTSFRGEEFFVQKIESDQPLYSVRKDALSINILQKDDKLSISAPPQQESFIRLMIVEEVLQLKELLSGLDAMKNPELMGAELMMQMFKAEENK